MYYILVTSIKNDICPILFVLITSWQIWAIFYRYFIFLLLLISFSVKCFLFCLLLKVMYFVIKSLSKLSFFYYMLNNASLTIEMNSPFLLFLQYYSKNITNTEHFLKRDIFNTTSIKIFLFFFNFFLIYICYFLITFFYHKKKEMKSQRFFRASTIRIVQRLNNDLKPHKNNCLKFRLIIACFFQKYEANYKT